MATINVTTKPENKEQKEVSTRVQSLVEDRNKAIAKSFNVEAKDVNVVLHRSIGAIGARIEPSGDAYGIFGGYVDYTTEILLIHPASAEGLLVDIWKELSILSDYGLIKMYLNSIYYPEKRQFRLYYKYLSDELAQILSGKFKDDIAKFEIKTYDEDKRYKKDQELAMVLYLMREYSGANFILEHLPKMFEECDIRKSVFAIYKKTFSELIKQEQKKLQEEEKKLQQAFAKTRR